LSKQKAKNKDFTEQEKHFIVLLMMGQENNEE